MAAGLDSTFDQRLQYKILPTQESQSSQPTWADFFYVHPFFQEIMEIHQKAGNGYPFPELLSTIPPLLSIFFHPVCCSKPLRCVEICRVEPSET